jgi:hypothetical protein
MLVRPFDANQSGTAPIEAVFGLFTRKCLANHTRVNMNDEADPDPGLADTIVMDSDRFVCSASATLNVTTGVQMSDHPSNDDGRAIAGSYIWYFIAWAIWVAASALIVYFFRT